jgi:hypothetical protein
VEIEWVFVALGEYMLAAKFAPPLSPMSADLDTLELWQTGEFRHILLHQLDILLEEVLSLLEIFHPVLVLPPAHILRDLALEVIQIIGPHEIPVLDE